MSIGVIICPLSLYVLALPVSHRSQEHIQLRVPGTHLLTYDIARYSEIARLRSPYLQMQPLVGRYFHELLHCELLRVQARSHA